MEDFESESDCNSSSDELESELYSVLHYNNFSGDLPSELVEKYNIRRENNEFFISLKKESHEKPGSEEVHKQQPDDFSEKSDDSLLKAEYLPSCPTTSQAPLLSDNECVRNIRKNNRSLSNPEDRSVNSTKCITPVKEFSKSSSKSVEDIIILDDSSQDSDNCVIQDSVQEVTYISSSSSVECLNDSDINMDGIMLNTSNHKVTLFPEAVGVEEKIEVKWREVASPSTWSVKMRKYYNKPSQELKFFDYEKILQEIKEKGPGNWDILPEDRFPLFKPVKRCTICRQTDHLMKNCPKRFSNCSMCGNPGHFATTCPYRMCLNCGKQSNLFISMCQQCESVRHKRCDECNQLGHIKANCPDTWRRYHSTTSGELVQRDNSFNENLMCCNCGRKGHLYENCNALYWSGYPPTSFLVKKSREILPSNQGRRNSFGARVTAIDEPFHLQRVSAEFHQTDKRPRWSEPNFNQNNFFNNVPSTPQSNKKKKNKKKKKTKSPHFQNNNHFNGNNTF